MNNPPQTLPNQVESAAVDNIQTEGMKEETMNVSKEIKEMRECIHQLNNVNEAMKKENEEVKNKVIDISNKMGDKEDPKSIKGVFLFHLAFACIAGFWIYEVISTYREEPLMSTTNIIQNKTFKWPTISIRPYRLCNNKNALEKLKREHNITLTPKNRIPFKINRNFDWSANNVSEMFLKTKYRSPHVNYTTKCKYISAARGETNCLHDDKLGTWQTYDTQFGVNEAFTPAPAVSMYDAIYLTINTSFCSFITVALHQSKDKYYSNHPSARDFYVPRGYYLLWKLSIEENNRVSTRSSPCVEDMNYNQPQCHDAKYLGYKMKMAGCNFPGISGYHQQAGDYPECNNASAFKQFKFWHQEIGRNELKYDDLQKNKDECGMPCHTKKYFITDKLRFYSRKRDRSGTIRLRLWLDPSAMYFQRVTESRAMTFDLLVANVGGILGLFLGLSCLTVVSAAQYVIRKLIKMYVRRVVGTH